VLVNVLGKMPKDLFLEFEGKQASELPSGDVKYHNGFSSDISTSGGPVHISLAFNPSHLEIVDPVVEGSVRARQRRRDDKTGDPEAVLFITQLALDFRQKFHKDVVIDIVCFRKLGHNEQDEPSITQPLMYKRIMQHPGTRKLYADKLLAQGVIAPEEPEALIKQYRAMLEAGQQTVSPVLSNFKSKFAVDWAPFLSSKWTDAADMQVPLAELQRL